MDKRYRLAQQIVDEDASKKVEDNDPTAVSRKKDHIDLAFRSQVAGSDLDSRFHYEPLLAAHPAHGSLPDLDFLGKTLRAPLWVSSMTGGTGIASVINRNLAHACGEFGLGMGLGSCRQLLFSDEHLPDFDVRQYMKNQPLFANLGVAQVEALWKTKELNRIEDLIGKLNADGLILHINPLQEALQPEGDVFLHSPLEVLEVLLDHFSFPIIAKEVGQGMGPASLEALLSLPLAAVEFAAGGGTNFAKLELLRSEPTKQELFEGISKVGHTAQEMLTWTNDLDKSMGNKRLTRHLILSGGISGFLDGYYLTETSKIPAIYGMASGFLRHAQGEYSALQEYMQGHIRGLELSRAYLRIARPKGYDLPFGL